MFSESQAAISIAKNPMHHHKTKHIEIDRHFISEKVNKVIIQLSYVPTKLRIVDVLTKALLRINFDELKAWFVYTTQLEGVCRKGLTLYAFS